MYDEITAIVIVIQLRGAVGDALERQSPASIERLDSALLPAGGDTQGRRSNHCLTWPVKANGSLLMLEVEHACPFGVRDPRGRRPPHD